MKDYPEWIEGKKIPVVDKNKSTSSSAKKSIVKRSNHKESPKKSDIKFD